MQSLRYILFAALFTAGIFTIVLYTSCNKDKCGSTTCQNGGTCSGSVCVCPVGYSGSSCGTGWSDVFIGTYKCSRDNCSPAVSGDNAWISSVTKGADGATISISNFDNSNITVSATVDSTQHIHISTVPPAYGVSASGSYISPNQVIMNFTTSSAGGIGGYTCRMIMTKE